LIQKYKKIIFFRRKKINFFIFCKNLAEIFAKNKKYFCAAKIFFVFLKNKIKYLMRSSKYLFYFYKKIGGISGDRKSIPIFLQKNKKIKKYFCAAKIFFNFSHKIFCKLHCNLQKIL
jgi:hypothetical protein